MARAADHSATLSMVRTDCVKELAAAGGQAGDSLVFNVVRQRKTFKTELHGMELEGFNFFARQGIHMAVASILSGGDVDESAAVPGGGVEAEQFRFGPMAGVAHELWVNYALKMRADDGGQHQGEAVVSIRGAAAFTKGNWDAFLRGGEVEFGFTPAGLRCFERVIGAHLETGTQNTGENIFLTLGSLGGQVATNQSRNTTLKPPVFRGTRYNMVFEGPSSTVQIRLGTQSLPRT